MKQESYINVVDLSVGFGEHVILKQLNFQVKSKQIVALMGCSGSGKSNLLYAMVGLHQPLAGDIFYDGQCLWGDSHYHRHMMIKHFGMMYQHGALWRSMTLEENIALPLRQLSNLSREQACQIAHYKLSLIGLADYANYLPDEVSLGMRKRVSIVRAMALDPELLFLDDPSAGIDPVNTKWFNELLSAIRDAFGTTIIIATNDVEIIYGIADWIIFLDTANKTILSQGNLQHMLSLDKDNLAHQYLTYGDTVKRGEN